MDHLEFSWNLYKQLSADLLDENLVFSPISIYIALAMIQLGATEDTNEQLKSLLGVTDSEFHLTLQQVIQSLKKQSSAVKLYSAERLYLAKGRNISLEFESKLKSHYSSAVHQTDFGTNKVKACHEINEWVTAQTNGKISQIFTPDMIDDETVLLLVTALYMCAEWAQKFSRVRNFSHGFHITKEKSVPVEMMQQRGRFKLFHSVQLECSILQLPYAAKEISMFFILPDVTNDLNTLEKKMSSENLLELLNSVIDTEVDLKIPKFTLDSSSQLTQTLTKLGLGDLFSREKSSLRGIEENGNLFVSSFVHKSMLNVNEEGTEATAATGVVARSNRMVREEPVEFTADHPFLFLIQDTKSKVILFTGRLVAPRPFHPPNSKNEL